MSPQDVLALVERFTDLLGPPLPDPSRGLHRWRCPVCGGGYNDPLQLYRPLVLFDDGRITCRAALRRGYVDDESCPFTLARFTDAVDRLQNGGSR